MTTSPGHLLTGLLCFILYQLHVSSVFCFRGDDDRAKAKIRLIRHPYIASIRNYGRYDCSGILIQDRVVLTAAQCVDQRYDRSPLPEVWLNSSTTFEPSEGTLIRTVVDVRMHPKYTGDVYDGYDLAVLLLNESTNPLPSIRFYSFTELEEGGSLSILGYGRASSSGSVSPVLLIGEVKIIDRQYCINDKDIVYLENQTICVQGSVPCDGDQGGPVFRNANDPHTDVLVGIISATSCAENQRMAAIQHASHPTTAEWVVHQRDEWGSPRESGCTTEDIVQFGQSLADAPQAEQAEAWDDRLLECFGLA